MFAPSREEARRFLFEAWRKYRQKEILSGLEDRAVRIILAHPEYHRLLEDWDAHGSRDWSPESGEANPFLHLSMHLAVDEQLAIDQPPGIRAAFARLANRLGSHDAEHAVIECLGEMLWEAQRNRTAPDSEKYLECVQRRARRTPS